MTANRKKLVDAIAEIAKTGVGRDQKNEQQGYMYRGADDVLNAITPVFAKHGIYMRPFYTIESTKEVATRSGTAEQICVRLELSLHDADCQDENNILLETTTYGEARDAGDKCIMKAETVALKYALIYALGIPVIGTENDPDSVSPEMDNTYNKRVSKTAQAKKPEPASVMDFIAQTKTEQAAPVEPVKAEPVKEEPVKVAEPVKEDKKPAEIDTKSSVVGGLTEQQRAALAAMGIL